MKALARSRLIGVAGAALHGIIGLDGIEKLGMENPNLIITDLNMPYMDGIEFVKTVRADPAPTQIFSGREGFKNGAQFFGHFNLTADHQTVAFGESPNAAAGSAIHKVYAFGFEHGCMADGIFVIRVAAVNDDVAFV